MSQDFKNFTVNPQSPSLDAFVITPGASALATPVRALFIGTGGTITVTTWRGNSVSLTVPDGAIIPLVVTHVTAATASNIVGFV
jgi:hypothetical protein